MQVVINGQAYLITANGIIFSTRYIHQIAENKYILKALFITVFLYKIAMISRNLICTLTVG